MSSPATSLKISQRLKELQVVVCRRFLTLQDCVNPSQFVSLRVSNTAPRTPNLIGRTESNSGTKSSCLWAPLPDSLNLALWFRSRCHYRWFPSCSQNSQVSLCKKKSKMSWSRACDALLVSTWSALEFQRISSQTLSSISCSGSWHRFERTNNRLRTTPMESKAVVTQSSIPFARSSLKWSKLSLRWSRRLVIQTDSSSCWTV